MSNPEAPPESPLGDRYRYLRRVVDGESLDQRLTRMGRIGVLEAVRVFRPPADTLAYSDELRGGHRDVNPANVLIGTDGVPRLVRGYDSSAQMQRFDRLVKMSGGRQHSFERPHAANSKTGGTSDIATMASTVKAGPSQRP